MPSPQSPLFEIRLKGKRVERTVRVGSKAGQCVVQLVAIIAVVVLVVGGFVDGNQVMGFFRGLQWPW